MGTHFSAVSGTGLARYRHGRLWEGGAESRPVGAAESGLSNAACRGPGAVGEGSPARHPGERPRLRSAPLPRDLPLPTLGPVPAPSLPQTRGLVGALHPPGTVRGARETDG